MPLKINGNCRQSRTDLPPHTLLSILSTLCSQLFQCAIHVALDATTLVLQVQFCTTSLFSSATPTGQAAFRRTLHAATYFRCTLNPVGLNAVCSVVTRLLSTHDQHITRIPTACTLTSLEPSQTAHCRLLFTTVGPMSWICCVVLPPKDQPCQVSGMNSSQLPQDVEG